MKRIAIIVALAAIALQSFAQDPISIIHGPYLQNLSETEVTIVWVSNNTSVGWVETAPMDGSHYYAVERPKVYDSKNGIKTESRIHSVRLTGLTPGTTYRYRVYSQEVLDHSGRYVTYGRVAATQAYRKEPFRFTTSDPSKETVTFAMINDIHANNDKLRTLLGQCDMARTDMVIFLGDMASMFNSEEQVFGDFMDTAVGMFASETPMYYTRGNHETRGNIAYRFQDYFSTLSDHIYYGYRQGPVYFIALDCGEDKPDSDIEYAGINVYDEYRTEQAEWLREIVKTEEFKTAPFRVVTMHMPPFEGWHGENDVRAKFLPILNEAGIDVMLCGHYHKLIRKDAGECAAFPILVNAANTVVKGEVTSDKLTLAVLDEAGKEVDRMSLDRKPSAAPGINILAHRGYCTDNGKVVTDENTLDALSRAQKYGCRAVEFDVHLTADGKLIVRHDNKITDDLSCQGSSFDAIRAFKLPFGHQIPSLREWLTQAKSTPEMTLFIEIKNHVSREKENQCVRLVLDEVKSLGMESQVRYLSFSAETCDLILKLNPGAKVNYNSSSLHGSMTPEDAASRGYAGISYQSPVFMNHPEWVARAGRLGLETMLWMVNCTYLRDLAIDLGCSWITTDFYDIVR